MCFGGRNTYDGAGNENGEVTHDLEMYKKVTRIDNSDEIVFATVFERSPQFFKRKNPYKIITQIAYFK